MDRDLAIFEEFRVDLDVVLPFFGDFIFFEDGLYRALGLACTTADALFGVDVELHTGSVFFYQGFFAALVAHGAQLFDVHCRVDTVNRADVDTRGITDATAWIGDYINHLRLSQLVRRG